MYIFKVISTLAQLTNTILFWIYIHIIFK